MAVVPAHATPVTGSDLLEAYGRAWLQLFEQYPTRDCILVLTSQTWMETGGTHLYNNNVGNSKAHGDGDVMVLHTREVINGKDIYIDAHFASFATLADGCADQVAMLHGTFPTCLQAAIAGDPVGFATQGHLHHYFTGDVTQYANGMHSAFLHFQGTLPPAPWEQELAAAIAAQPIVPDGTAS